MCELDDYRLEALVVLPQLERLDKDLFTEDERAEAEEVSTSVGAHDVTIDQSATRVMMS